MTWEEYQKNFNQIHTNRELTEVECPQCGAHLWRRTDVVLTSYPPQYQYECDTCNWRGTGY